jgi:hypothetical protein
MRIYNNTTYNNSSARAVRDILPISNIAHHGYHNTAASVSFPPPDDTPTTNESLYQPEQQRLARNAARSFAIPILDVALARTLRPTSTATPGFSHARNTSSASTAAILPSGSEALPPPGFHGLRFDSGAAASAATDRLFHASFEAPVSAAGDDAIQIQERKRHRVKSLVEALRHNGYLPRALRLAWRWECRRSPHRDTQGCPAHVARKRTQEGKVRTNLKRTLRVWLALSTREQHGSKHFAAVWSLQYLTSL